MANSPKGWSKGWSYFINTLTICLLESLFIIAFILVLAGVHAVDTAWNMKTVLMDTGVDYVDITLGGFVVTATDAYRNGVAEILMGAFLMFLISALTYLRHSQSHR